MINALRPVVFRSSLAGAKPPLSWCKSAAKEYRRLHPDADLHECAAAGVAQAYDDLLDHLRAKL